MKLGIIVDSASGLTEKEALARGWYYIPINLTINDQEYLDGINIDDAQFYKLINMEASVSTAATSLGLIQQTFEEASKENDHVLYYPISEDLSIQSTNARLLLKEFPKIKVVKSKLISGLIAQECDYAARLFKKSENFDEVFTKIEDRAQRFPGFFIPSNLNWLKKGGRINAATAMLGNLLNICPIITFNGAMHKGGKARTLTKAVTKGLEKLKEELAHRKEQLTSFDFIIVHSIHNDPEYLNKKNKIVKLLQKDFKVRITHNYPMPRLIVIHTYLNALGVIAVPKEEKL